MAIYKAMIIQLWEIKCKSMQQRGLVDFGNWWSRFLDFIIIIFLIGIHNFVYLINS